jgi:hypothetical protein
MAIPPRDNNGSSGNESLRRQQPNISRKRGRSKPPKAPAKQPHTIPCLFDLIDTCTYEQFIKVIHNLPKGWTATNDMGNAVTKR